MEISKFCYDCGGRSENCGLTHDMQDIIPSCFHRDGGPSRDTGKLDTIVVSVFPACCKTWLFNHQDNFGLKILDSDSSQFSWIYRKRTEEEVQEGAKIRSVNGRITKNLLETLRNEVIKVRNSEFPGCYIDHIKKEIESGQYHFIFVSSHKEVRDALDAAGIQFMVVYPYKGLMEEWVGRCYIREMRGDQGFPIKFLIDNWDAWMNQMEECAKTHFHRILSSGHTLSDALLYNRYDEDKQLDRNELRAVQQQWLYLLREMAIYKKSNGILKWY